MLACAPVEYNCFEATVISFINPARQNQLIQEYIFSRTPVGEIATVMYWNSALNGSYTKNPFCYQKSDLRQIRLLRAGHSIVDFDAVHICCLWVTKMKSLNLQDSICSIPIHNFEDHYVLVFDMISMQKGTGNCH